MGGMQQFTYFCFCFNEICKARERDIPILLESSSQFFRQRLEEGAIARPNNAVSKFVFRRLPQHNNRSRGNSNGGVGFNERWDMLVERVSFQKVIFCDECPQNTEHVVFA